MSSIFVFASSANTVKIKFIVVFAEHLHRHSRQRPFKVIPNKIFYLLLFCKLVLTFFYISVQFCTGSRFCSLDALNRHLIINHNDDSVVDFDTDNDTLCDENEKLNLGMLLQLSVLY